MGSRQNQILWKWPQFGTDGKHGDDTAIVTWSPLGDWNQDGYPDLAASTARTNPQNGAHKAGHVAVLDGRTGEELWAAQGQRHYESMSFLGFHSQSAQCDLVLLSHYGATDYLNETSFPMNLHSWMTRDVHAAPRRIGLVTASTVGTLVSSRRSEHGIAWIQFVTQQSPYSLVAMERYDWEGGEAKLTSKVRFEKGLFSDYGFSAALSVGDLDGDGEEECAYFLSTDIVVAKRALKESKSDLPAVCLVVSSGSLELLAMQHLPGRPWGCLHWTHVPLLVPATDGIGSDAYMLCTPPNAPLTERNLFKIAFRPTR
jgi:hypothetical protein